MYMLPHVGVNHPRTLCASNDGVDMLKNVTKEMAQLISLALHKESQEQVDILFKSQNRLQLSRSRIAAAERVRSPSR